MAQTSAQGCATLDRGWEEQVGRVARRMWDANADRCRDDFAGFDGYLRFCLEDARADLAGFMANASVNGLFASSRTNGGPTPSAAGDDLLQLKHSVDMVAVDGLRAVTFAGDSDSSQGRRFEGTAYTGSPVQRGFGRFAIDVSGMSIPPTVPLLRGHDHEIIVGQGRASKLASREVGVNGRLYTATENSREVLRLHDAGFRWKLSVGIDIPEPLERIGEGERTQVNGHSVVGPALVARKSDLLEISFVPVPADPGTAVKVFNDRVSRLSDLAVV